MKNIFSSILMMLGFITCFISCKTEDAASPPPVTELTTFPGRNRDAVAFAAHDNAQYSVTGTPWTTFNIKGFDLAKDQLSIMNNQDSMNGLLVIHFIT